MSVNSESDSSSSSEEDEYACQLTDNLEKEFFKTLSSLKNKDPTIYDKNTCFFKNDSTSKVLPPKSKNKKEGKEEKPFYLRDYEIKMMNESENVDTENLNSRDEHNNKLSYVEEQRKIKDSFKSFLDDDSDGENESLLVKHKKTKQEVEKEESDYIQWLKGQKEELEDKEVESSLKPLHDYWNKDNLDEGEEFLKDYILNKRFLEDDPDDPSDGILDDDSDEMEEIEEFEQKFNFRFEDESNEAELLKRYPRTIEGSLRRKNDKRKKKREEIKERKKIEKQKKRDEVNRKKNVKAQEIEERLNKLKSLTGNEKLAFQDEDILGDFNAEEFDKKMATVYNDEFYSVEDNVKPDLKDIHELGVYNDLEENADYDIDNMDCEGPSYREKKLTRTKKKKLKKKTFADVIDQSDKPTFDPSVHESYNKFMDEYYQLDCEDFIEDLPCRFKYRNVEPNSFGLTVEEILAADDKELNCWSSNKKLQKIRSNHVEKNEANIYKKKAENESLKRKILPSLYKLDEEEKDVSKEEESKDNNVIEDNKLEIVKQKKSKKRKFNNVQSAPHDTTVNPKKFKGINKSCASKNNSNSIQLNKGDGSDKVLHTKKKRKFGDRQPMFHDSRLTAYGINPKKFKHK